MVGWCCNLNTTIHTFSVLKLTTNRDPLWSEHFQQTHHLFKLLVFGTTGCLWMAFFFCLLVSLFLSLKHKSILDFSDSSSTSSLSFLLFLFPYLFNFSHCCWMFIFLFHFLLLNTFTLLSLSLPPTAALLSIKLKEGGLPPPHPTHHLFLY